MTKKLKPWTANQRKFQQWLALPSPLREPATQQEFSKVMRVAEATLSRWKHWQGLNENGQKEGFQDAVNRYARHFLGDDIPEVFAVLREKAKEGSYQHMRLYLEMVGEYVEAHDITSGGEPLQVPYIEVVKEKDA